MVIICLIAIENDLNTPKIWLQILSEKSQVMVHCNCSVVGTDHLLMSCKRGTVFNLLQMQTFQKKFIMENLRQCIEDDLLIKYITQ